MSFFHRFKNGFAFVATGTALSLGLTGAAVAQQCPDWQLGGIPISTDAEAAWIPQEFPLFAGGSIDLSACPTVEGFGRVTPAPNFTLTYDALSLGRDLDFRTQTDCDTTLLINDSSGAWHFNDDADGTLQSRLRLPAAATGRFDVWVGTFGSTSCQATLIVETFPAAEGGTGGATGGGGAAQACPDWSLGGAEIQLNAGASDTRQVVAGGPVSLFGNQCGVEGVGYVAEAPDFSLYYDAADQNATLNLAVVGQCDTTLLVNDPNTAWLFNDDFTDLNPAIEIAGAPSGRYDIWVGTYGQSTCQSSITIASNMAMGQQPPASK